MRILRFSGLVLVAVSAISCKSLEFNANSQKNSVTGAGQQVDALAFNALEIWAGRGDANPVTNVPTEWSVIVNNEEPSVAFGWGPPRAPVKVLSMTPQQKKTFFIERSCTGFGDAQFCNDGFFDQKKNFVAVITAGATVEGNTLNYGINERTNRELKLVFSDILPEKTQFEAQADCGSKKMRLPTAREIFDFCGAGIPELNYGPDYSKQMNRYPVTARCGKDSGAGIGTITLWSVSVPAWDVDNAYVWSNGFVLAHSRARDGYSRKNPPENEKKAYRCVARTNT
jgi:hypothetical protein